MTHTTERSEGKGIVVAAADGATWWFLGSRMTRLAGVEDTRGRFTLLQQDCPPGFAPPRHVHHLEHEAFYVIDGSMTVVCGNDSWDVSAGDFVNLPRGVWHGFTASDDGVRILHLTSPAQFEQMVRDVGVPATGNGFRRPEPEEFARLARALPKYGIEIDEPKGDRS